MEIGVGPVVLFVLAGVAFGFSIGREAARKGGFNRTIGQLDRSLSEFLGLYHADLDEADLQTLKHHAHDLIGAGQKMLGQLAKEQAKQQSREEFLRENPPWS